MTIGERIRLIRKETGQTQADFGEKIGLKQSSMGQIESGVRNATDRIILLICEKFSVNEEWLRNEKGTMFTESDETIISDVAAQYHLGDLDKAIMKIFLELSPEKREAFKEFAFTLVDTVLNDDALYTEYRDKYVEDNALPYAARGGHAEKINELRDLYDQCDGEPE